MIQSTPIQPKIYGTLQSALLFKREDGDLFCIGTMETDNYLVVPERSVSVIFQALVYMDGDHSISEIQANMDRTYGKGTIDVGKLVDICCSNGLLVEGKASGHDENEFHVMLTNLITVSLNRLQTMFAIAAHILRPIVSCMVLTIAVALLLVLTGRVEIPWSDLMTNPIVLPMVWTLQFLSILPHEFAHAVVAKQYGLKPKSATLCVFYYLGLAVYVSTPGIYLQPPRNRLSIWLAGPFTNMFMASLFVFLQAVVSKGAWYVIFVMGALINFGLAIGNMLPLLYSDGYYVVSTLLKVPNLRGGWAFGHGKTHGMRPAIKKTRRIYRHVVSSVLLLMLIVQLVSMGLLGLNTMTIDATIVSLFHSYPNAFFAVTLGICVRIVTWTRSRFGAAKRLHLH